MSSSGYMSVPVEEEGGGAASSSSTGGPSSEPTAAAAAATQPHVVMAVPLLAPPVADEGSALVGAGVAPPPARKISLFIALGFCAMFGIALLIFLVAVLLIALMTTPYRADYFLLEKDSYPLLRGTLPNGVRYSILPNSWKPGRVTTFVMVDVGSVDESESERGMAHLVEHLAFDHTTDFPKRGGIWDAAMLSGGLFNAFTSFRNTVYLFFDVPSDSLSAALSIHRNQISEQIHFSENTFLEKGAVLSEGRISNESMTTALESLLRNHGGESWRVGKRFPIGRPDLIAGWSTNETQRFFRRWYSPSHFHVIVVGDLPLDAMKKSVEKTFSSVATKRIAAESDQEREAPREPIGDPHPLKPFLLQDVEGLEGVWLNLIVTQKYSPHLHNANFYRNDMLEKIFSVFYLAQTISRYYLMYPQEDLFETSRMAAALVSNEYSFDAKMHFLSVLSPGRGSEGPWDRDFEAAVIELRRLAQEGPSEWLTTVVMYVAHALLYVLEEMGKDMDSIEMAILIMGDMDPSSVFVDLAQFRELHAQFLDIGFVESARAAIQTEAQFLWNALIRSVSSEFVDGERIPVFSGLNDDSGVATLNVFVPKAERASRVSLSSISMRSVAGVVRRVALMKDLGPSPLEVVLQSLSSPGQSPSGENDGLRSVLRPIFRAFRKEMSPIHPPQAVDEDVSLGIRRFRLANGVGVNVKIPSSGRMLLPRRSPGTSVIRLTSLGGKAATEGVSGLEGGCRFVNEEPFHALRFVDSVGRSVDVESGGMSSSLQCAEETLRISVQVEPTCEMAYGDDGEEEAAKRGGELRCHFTEEQYETAALVGRLMMRPVYSSVETAHFAKRLLRHEESNRVSMSPIEEVIVRLRSATEGRLTPDVASNLDPLLVTEWVAEQFRPDSWEISVVGEADVPLLLSALNRWLGTLSLPRHVRAGRNVLSAKLREKFTPAWLPSLSLRTFDKSHLKVCERRSDAAERAFTGVVIPAFSFSQMRNPLQSALADGALQSALFRALRLHGGFTYFVFLASHHSILRPTDSYHEIYWAPGPYPPPLPSSADPLNVNVSVLSLLKSISVAPLYESLAFFPGIKAMAASLWQAHLLEPLPWLDVMEGLSLPTPASLANSSLSLRSYADLDFVRPFTMSGAQYAEEMAAIQSSQRHYGFSVQTVGRDAAAIAGCD